MIFTVKDVEKCCFSPEYSAHYQTRRPWKTYFRPVLMTNGNGKF